MSTLTKTDRFQNNIGYLFIGIWICALIGFHKTYTVFFPAFKGFRWEQHFHGLMLMSWFAMLIIQPFLIKFERPDIHRVLGKAGYVLAPLVCYSIFMVTKMVYYREIAVRPENSVLAQLSLDIPTIFIFGLFFLLAMINRHRSDVHMRYMIGTSLLMIGPGLGRALIIFGAVPFPVAVTIVYYVAEIIALLFLFSDVRKRGNSKPLLTILIVLIINHLIWAFQESTIWQKTAKWFVTMTF
jgi:hypothetical protein